MMRIDRHPAGLSMVKIERPGPAAHTILSSPWIPGGDRAYIVRLSCAGSAIHVAVYGDKNVSFLEKTPELTAGSLDSATFFGVGTEATDADFSHLKSESPFTEPGHYTAQAEAAMADLVKNYWVGGLGDGCIKPTWNGYSAAVLPDARGGLWERGMVIFAMDTLHHVTADAVLRRRLELEWQRIKRLYSAADLEAAGTTLHLSCDDVGWHAALYLTLYQYSRDRYALDRATGLLNKGFERWLDGELGGGLWYSNEHKYKSLYQVGMIRAALRVAALTGDKKLRETAWGCYDWIESRLLRPDRLYWCDYSREGPIGRERPEDIREAGSVSFLAGNMAMGTLHAQRYRTTGDPKYLERALQTAAAIHAKYVREGVLIDDRDAWANGTFAAAWVEDVLTLPGIDRKHSDTLGRTADSIFQKARTKEGFYGGSWSGPSSGPGSAWCVKGSRPEQIMTSGSSANVIMAAALAERKAAHH